VAPRPITFLSDYGYADEFAGVCRAVIARIEPGARLIDLSHGVPAGAVRQGAVSLGNSLPFTPAGIHLAVVDPGVGSERRAVAVEAAQDGRILVGPDNGLLWPAIERLGGAVRAVDLAASPFRLDPVSRTFHGRDLFAPVAAHLAGGAKLKDAGEEIDAATLTRLELPQARVGPGRAVAHVLHVDGFGNVALNVGSGQLAGGFLDRASASASASPSDAKQGDTVMVQAGGSKLRARLGKAFADVPPGEAVLYEDSSGSLAIAINQGSAAGRLGVAADDEVVLSPGG
jgi:S-adenosylmethionine hydrolase